MFGLIDCNNFYASCQRVFQPGLACKPVVVLSNNDGCVIARSNEAKQLGIPMGAAAFQYEKIFERHQVHVFSSNYTLYGDMSQRVMNILAGFTPKMEVYSIDEAFLDFSGFDRWDLQEYGRQIHARVKQYTGIPTSIGIAPTKALAKVANKIAKKFPDHTSHCYVIDSDKKRTRALKWTSVGDVWGIGKQHAVKLRRHGVNDALAFTQLSDDWVRHQMAVTGLRLKHDLEGRSSIAFEEPAAKKNISATRSFENDLCDYDQLRERVATFAENCAVKLRKQQSHCNALEVFLLENPFRSNLPSYSKSIRIGTDFATNSTLEITKFAVAGLRMIYEPGFYFKKAGVIVSGLTPANASQTNLFTGHDDRHDKLMQAIDLTNKKIGTQKIRFGAQDFGCKWKIRRERLSPRYTTCWDDIPVVDFN